MAYDYSGDQATAAEMIAEFGATYELQAEGGTRIGSVIAVMTDDTKKLADGSVKAIKVLLIAGNTGAEPKAGMWLAIGGETLTVVDVDRVRPGATTVLYQCEVSY